MIKKIISCITNKYLLIAVRYRAASLATTPLKNDHQSPPKKKAYQLLLTNNLGNLVKFPTADILKVLRSRGIIRLMASNHELGMGDQVLQAHVLCLYAIIQRGETSLQPICMFTDTIYNQIHHLMPPSELTNSAFLNLLNPHVLTKLVKIAQTLTIYYNQYFRSLISLLIVRLLAKSNFNQMRQKEELRKLDEETKLARAGKIVVKDGEGNSIKIDELDAWEEERRKEIKQELRYLGEIDYWNGFYYVLNADYYTDDLLIQNINKLEKQLERDPRALSLPELLLKIKCLVELHRFKDHKSVANTGLKTLTFSYGKLVDQYFKVLSNSNIIDLINHQDSLIQAQLLTVFLSQDHYQRARKVYLEIFKTIFNASVNGTLLADTKLLRGIFEVVLVLFTHEDTQEVHQLLAQLERIMMMYPIEIFEKLETHCIVAEKYGYKSEYLAEKFMRVLLSQKEKLDRSRGYMHLIHQTAGQINLAKKIMLCSRLMYKPKQNMDQLVGELFEPNVWMQLNGHLLEGFITASSYSHFIYFMRTGLVSITSSRVGIKRIKSMCAQVGLKNFNRAYVQIMDEIKNNSVFRSNCTLDHGSHWRQNPHARLLSLLELANYHHAALKSKSPQDAKNFIKKFLAQTLGSSFFYNVLKIRFSYPGMLENFMELMREANLERFPIQHRDLDAVKQLYHSQLSTLTRGTVPFSHYYQQRLEQVHLNLVRIPFNQEVYKLGNLRNCAASSLLCQAMRRFQKQKEYLRIQIETFFKFNQLEGVQVAVNYLEMPHLADLIIRTRQSCTVVLFHSYEGEPKHFINWKQLQMQREADGHWHKKGYRVWVIKGEKDLSELMNKVIRRWSTR